MSTLTHRWFVLGMSVVGVLALPWSAGAAEEESAPSVEISAPAISGPFVGLVTGSKVNIRAGANLNYEVLHKVAQGEQLVVTGQTGDWYAIELPADAPCYVAAKFVAQDGAAGVGRITGTTVNVRGGPGTKYNVLGKVAAGELVSIVSAEGEWLRIVPPATVRGWIAATYLRPEPAAQVDAVRALLASRRPSVAIGGIVPPTGAGAAHSPLALVSAPLAQGRLERARGLWKRPGTHQLVQERKTVAFLASEAIALDDYLHQDVAVWGSIADPSRAVPQITVTQVAAAAVSPTIAPAADASSTPQ